MLRYCALVLICAIATSVQAQTISAGNNHSIILRHDTLMVSWGQNDNLKLGFENSGRYSLPKATPFSFVAISAGNAGTIALKVDGSLWGMGDYQNSGSFLVTHQPSQHITLKGRLMVNQPGHA